MSQILVDYQIHERMNQMFDFGKSENTDMNTLCKQINPNSIDLTIGKDYKRPSKLKNPVLYGFSGEKERDLYNLTYWRDCSADEGYIELKPNDVILGVTREYVTMPVDVCGQIFTKSTLGRMFINHMMAGVVDAGFCGRLTLEFRNDGIHTVRIPVGARVVQMICYGLLNEPVMPYGAADRGSRYMGAVTVECAKFSQQEHK
ncbi:MAG: dCTP deaminase [Flexilinea sp.]|nr:dCTP deaminase [Flexilinea sp.]